MSTALTAQSPSEFPRPLAVVTGASAGLGALFARQLAERGFDLLLVARDAERLRSLADELALQYAIVAEPWPADLSRDEGMRTLAEYLARNDRVMVVWRFDTPEAAADDARARLADLIRAGWTVHW